MKKIPQKKLRRINALQNQIGALGDEYTTRVGILRKKYKIDDINLDQKTHAGTDYDKLDKYYDFLEEQGEVLNDVNYRQCVLDAKWMAMFLIATNIARRGKYLHPEVAIRKLKKYKYENSKYIITELEMPVVSQILNSKSYLASELYKSYDVMLLNQSKYIELVRYISMYPGQKADKYKNLLKKFHKQNTIECILYKMDDRSF